MTTPFHINSKASQFNITKGLRSHSLKIMLLWWNPCKKIKPDISQTLTVFKAPKDQLLKAVLDKFEVDNRLETVAQSEAQRLKHDISSVPTRWCSHYFKILQLKCIQRQSVITSEKFGPDYRMYMWMKVNEISWQTIKISCGATDAPFDENSKALQFNMSQVCRLDWPNMKTIHQNPYEEYLYL